VLQNIRLNRIHRPIAKSDGHRFPEFSPNTSAPPKKETEYWVFSDFLLPNPLHGFLSIPPTPSSLEPSAAPRKIRFELKSSGNRRFFFLPQPKVSPLSIRSVAARVPVPRQAAAAATGREVFIGSSRATIVHRYAALSRPFLPCGTERLQAICTRI
jgi:hypothetical protein